MPTYPYACTACGHTFEAQQSFTEPSLTQCPECSGRLRKVFSSVGVVFKGSGFYRTDSRTGSGSASTASSSAAAGSGGDGSSSGGASSGGSTSGGSTSGASTSGSGGTTTPSSTGSSSGGASAAPAAAKKA